MICTGNNKEHCCWCGSECEFLEVDTIPGRHWVCSLMRELNDWNLVHKDERYMNSPIGKYFAEHFPRYGCGDYPQNIPDIEQRCCFG